jgi:uncharacterized protein YeaO (DUF488 family)
MGELIIKRVYDPADAADGFRALVDRLWPRGVSKERAELDAWWKDLAPAPALRTEWHHDPARFDEFAAAYRAELDNREFVAEALDVIRSHDRVTLLFAAHDPHVNHAAVLRDYLATRL